MRSLPVNAWFGVAAAVAVSGVFAQQAAAPAAAPPAAPPAAPASISSSLGVVVFPSKNQTPAQQSNDEGYCYGWAKTQSGIDPMTIKPAAVQPAPTEDPSTAGSGSRARGAARGAAGGAVIGAISGDAGKGAAIGASAGVLAGGANKRRAQQDAAAQQQQAQAAAGQQAQASIEQQKAIYNKSFATCMQGKGYSAN
jgi:Glycine-zipper domain